MPHSATNYQLFSLLCRVFIRFTSPLSVGNHSIIIDRLRDLSYQPGLLQLKYLFRHFQALAYHRELRQLRELATLRPLQPLVLRQPRLLYKYLGYYMATSFSRPMRLTAILHHYQFLLSVVRPDFFKVVAKQPIIWQTRIDNELFSIELSYPVLTWAEGELSLHFFRNSTLLQMITFVLVPGAIVGAPAPHTLLVGQVQGTKDAEAIRATTKQLHDITPANLLIHAAYGLAKALSINYVAGVSTQEQLRGEDKFYFDYDAFWMQFRGERLVNQLYLFDVDAPERPIEETKAKYRLRTLRKRQYKQQLRVDVARYCQATFLLAVAQTADAVV